MGSTFVVTNTNDGGFGSLRSAIDRANATPNSSDAPDEIDFDIPGDGVHTIAISYALSQITDPVIINGWSQPGWNGAPLIEVTAQPGATMDGLSITAGASTVRGLVLNNFAKAIAISQNGHNTVQGCYIGTDGSGIVAVPNDVGIYSDQAPGNTVGGTTAEARNVISGNRLQALYFSDPTQEDQQTSATTVQGNYIGTDVTGRHAVPNYTAANSNGQPVTGAVYVSSFRSLVGGSNPGAGNLISGNNAAGLWQYGSGAVILGNVIGTDVTGSVGLPNAGVGIAMQSLHAQVGGPKPGEGNLVSGNLHGGIAVNSSSSIAQGNKIGTSIDGSQSVPNTGAGISVAGDSNIIGGADRGAGNLISGNQGAGILLATSSSFTGGVLNAIPAFNTIVFGNLIGTNGAGTGALPNTADGIDAHAGQRSVIGSTSHAAANVISGNGGNGITLGSGDTVRGNRIGTQIDGLQPLGNHGHGIAMSLNNGGTIGAPSGTSLDAGNVIAFNGGAGVAALFSSTSPSSSPPPQRISSNSIHDNGGLAIDVGAQGVSAPLLQITAAFGWNAKLTIYGSIHQSSAGQYILEFYADKSADPSGYGEAEIPLGQATVTTDANGSASFNVTFPLPTNAAFVTASVIDPKGTTSELAADVAISPTAPSATSVAANDVAVASYAQLLNISTRLQVGTGDHVLIGGFIVAGNDPKKVLVRGLGPSLSNANVSGVLADPLVELHDSLGVVVSNDDWKNDQRAEIEATGIPPANDRESAIVRTLSPGAYSVILRGKDDGTGIGLVEVYDLAPTLRSRLANISTRGYVTNGDNVMIGGFIAGSAGAGHADVVVRALGVSLSDAGVPDSMYDPNLELRDANGTLMRANENWAGDPYDTSYHQLTALGLAPQNSREAAMLVNVAAGNYTAIVRGTGAGTALVEVYDVGY